MPPPAQVFLGLERVARTWTRRLALLGGWLLLAVAVATVADALLRKFLSRPIQGTFEATGLLLAVILFFALPYTSLTDGHVSTEILTGRLPRRARWVLIGANALVSALVFAALAHQMALLAVEFAVTARTTITTRIPVFPFLAPVTGAAVLAAAGCLIHGLGALLRAISPALPPPGASPGGA